MSSDHAATLTAEYIHKIANDETTEHISLGEDFAILAGAEEPENISHCFEYKNRLRSRRTQLIFYAEGYLRVREWQRQKKIRDYLLSLRFLSPAATRSRHLPTRIAWVATGCAGFAALCALVSWLSPWNALFTPAALAGAAAAAVAGFVFLYLAHEKTRFRTQAGKSTVLTLVGTADSFKRCRSLVPEIESAIVEAQIKNVENRSDYLRQEMREHYRLLEFGAIDHDACSDATRRILANFG
jgi:hypothetical protein